MIPEKCPYRKEVLEAQAILHDFSWIDPEKASVWHGALQAAAILASRAPSLTARNWMEKELAEFVADIHDMTRLDQALVWNPANEP